jgi:hypothetical protein
MVAESTNESNDLTTCSETASGEVSVWQEVIVCTTTSTSEGSAMLDWESRRPGPGDGGGEGSEARSADESSTKNECEMSLVMQSNEAIINFSERVSHARRRGSKISRGWSPARSARTNSSALCVLSRRGVDLLASRDAAIVSSAEVISTEETGFPLGTVSERRWFVLLGEGAEGNE